LALQAIDLLGLKIPIKVHPRRKRLALRITGGGEVSVLSPPGVGLKTLQTFAKQHQAWLEEKLAVIKQRPSAVALNCAEDEVWPYLGQDLTLQFHPENRIRYSGNQLWLPKSDDHPCGLVLGWYQVQASIILPPRFDYWIQRTALQPSNLQIKGYKSRWGSCDRHRRIQLNWKLMAMPEWVIDYVMVHDLCHLQHMNHSSAFWQLVEQHYPKTLSAKRWMKQHSPAIMRQLTP
jgi:predicted metal-dependent hydrolase